MKRSSCTHRSAVKPGAVGGSSRASGESDVEGVCVIILEGSWQGIHVVHCRSPEDRQGREREKKGEGGRGREGGKEGGKGVKKGAKETLYPLKIVSPPLRSGSSWWCRNNLRTCFCLVKTCEILSSVYLISACSRRVFFCGTEDQGYGRGGTPIFTGVFEPLARVALYPTDEDGLGTWFAAA